MREIIALNLVSTQAESGFNLNELVYAVEKAFSGKGFPALLEFIIHYTDEAITIGVLSSRGSWQCSQCCEDMHLELHGKYPRTFKTSLGVINLKCRQLRCRNCKRKIVPLREFMNWESYSRKSTELEKTVIDIVSEQSYRRSSQHLDNAGMVPVPKSTSHRWVAQSNCTDPDDSVDDIDLLYADGTGFKRKPDKKAGKNNRGEVRVALGITKGGRVHPFGAWTDSSWDEIKGSIREQLYDETAGKLNKAECAIIDGEHGLGEIMAELANGQQRCGWHVVRDIGYTMWQEKAGLTERKLTAKNLAGILNFELPEEDFERVGDKDKKQIRKQLKESEKMLSELSDNLLKRGYEKAANHIAKATDKLFTHVRFWLKTGLVVPRVSSWIERIMREVGRRIKKIGFGWSEEGAAKMTNIILRRLDVDKWESFWKEKMQLKGRVIVNILSVKSITSP